MSDERTPISGDSETSEARRIRDELDREHARNRDRRLAFVKSWAEYVRTHPDEEWARQQKTLIDGQVPDPDTAQSDTDMTRSDDGD